MRRSSCAAPPAAPWADLEPEPEPLVSGMREGAEQREHFVEHQIALSVVHLEDQLHSVQHEAAEVLGLCDSTTAFANEVRDGLRLARASMAEQRATMDKILASVTGASPQRVLCSASIASDDLSRRETPAGRENVRCRSGVAGRGAANRSSRVRR